MVTEKAENNHPTQLNYGWVCPKCGRVYSPYASMCSYCTGYNISVGRIWNTNESELEIRTEGMSSLLRQASEELKKTMNPKNTSDIL